MQNSASLVWSKVLLIQNLQKLGVESKEINKFTFIFIVYVRMIKIDYLLLLITYLLIYYYT